jgi:hypothetical protein
MLPLALGLALVNFNLRIVRIDMEKRGEKITSTWTLTAKALSSCNRPTIATARWSEYDNGR